MKHLLKAIPAVLLLAGCDMAPRASVTQSDEPEWLQNVGKPLTRGDMTVTLNPDGTITGSGFEGTWEERDGKYCRTLTKPERLAGTECQTVTVNGNEVTIVSESGTSTTWTY